jgi:hypothetical protein
MNRRSFIHRVLYVSGAFGALGASWLLNGGARQNRPVPAPVPATGYQVAVDYLANLGTLPSGLYASAHGDDGFMRWRADPARRAIRFELDERARYWDGRPIERADIHWAWARSQPLAATLAGVPSGLRIEAGARSARKTFEVRIDQASTVDESARAIPLLIRATFGVA